tara:strand:+ start:2339 stop:3268 length:930 start_codon:yes stop_codon:yes gene_type:complete
MNLQPLNQKNLYELDHYLIEFINLYKNNRLPNKILLSGDKGIGKNTLAYHLVNFILSQDEKFPYDDKKFEINENNKSFKLTINGSNPNLTLIDASSEKESINIDQIRDLISNLNKTSFNNKERFVIIDNIETLSVNSVNALLKILEEPPSNIFFILINNYKFILPTLKSRCINFKIFLNHEKTLSITRKLLNGDVYKHINSDLFNYYTTPGYIYKFVSIFVSNNYNLLDYDIKKLLKLIIKDNLYKKDKLFKNIAFEYFEFFCRKKISTTQFKKFDFYSYFLKRINDTKKFNLDDESLFIEFEYKVLNG